MKIVLNRTIEETNSCCGDWIVDDVLICNTLEPSATKQNDRGKQAIPADTYVLKPFNSPKFKTVVPLLTMDETTGTDESAHRYEVHWGNSHKDTDDCILLGIYVREDWIRDSRMNWNLFMVKYFNIAVNNGEDITLEINDCYDNG